MPRGKNKKKNVTSASENASELDTGFGFPGMTRNQPVYPQQSYLPQNYPQFPQYMVQPTKTRPATQPQDAPKLGYYQRFRNWWNKEPQTPQQPPKTSRPVMPMMPMANTPYMPTGPMPMTNGPMPMTNGPVVPGPMNQTYNRFGSRSEAKETDNEYLI